MLSLLIDISNVCRQDAEQDCECRPAIGTGIMLCFRSLSFGATEISLSPDLRAPPRWRYVHQAQTLSCFPAGPTESPGDPSLRQSSQTPPARQRETRALFASSSTRVRNPSEIRQHWLIRPVEAPDWSDPGDPMHDQARVPCSTTSPPPLAPSPPFSAPNDPAGPGGCRLKSGVFPTTFRGSSLTVEAAIVSSDAARTIGLPAVFRPRSALRIHLPLLPLRHR